MRQARHHSIPDNLTATYTHRVAFHETDGMGVLYHGNYSHLFERARLE